VRLILDTHLFLWFVDGWSRVPKTAQDHIEEADQISISAASLWEIAIKAGIGKIDAPIARLPALVERSGFHHLPVAAEHAVEVARLPRHHRDPFDRLLIAQARATGMKLLTVDAALKRYGADVIIA